MSLPVHLVSMEREAFAKHILDTHEDVCPMIAESAHQNNESARLAQKRKYIEL